MKKLLFVVAIVATSAVVLSSCKKDYTCTCKDSNGSSVSVTYHTTKSKAKDACNSAGSTYGSSYSCSIQ
jgi:hypothetical protein